MAEAFEEIGAQARERLGAANDLDALRAWHRDYLGRGGRITALLRELGKIPPDQRAAAGKAANVLKQSLESAFEQRQEAVGREAARQSAETDAVDVTLPGRPVASGRLHPSTATIRQIVSIFKGMGFSVFDAPEVETDEINFELLNIPPGHPARDMWDTFYTTTPGLILRTHTSSFQIHAMRASAPRPIRIISAGKCFRYEELSARAESMFHQVEGLVVGPGVTFGDLKGVLLNFIDQIYGLGRKVRMRKSYFPFTEPSVEVDVNCSVCGGKGCSLCKHSGWLEVLGAGMVHPTVLRNGGYDPALVSGFAFGMGPERLTMLKYNIDDIRYFFSNDIRFLRRFP